VLVLVDEFFLFFFFLAVLPGRERNYYHRATTGRFNRDITAAPDNLTAGIPCAFPARASGRRPSRAWISALDIRVYRPFGIRPRPATGRKNFSFRSLDLPRRT